MPLSLGNLDFTQDAYSLWHKREAQLERQSLDGHLCSKGESNLAMQIGAELFGDALAAGEERGARLATDQDLIHHGAVAVHIVCVRGRHAHMVQHPQERLRYNAHPATSNDAAKDVRNALTNLLPRKKNRASCDLCEHHVVGILRESSVLQMLASSQRQPISESCRTTMCMKQPYNMMGHFISVTHVHKAQMHRNTARYGNL